MTAAITKKDKDPTSIPKANNKISLHLHMHMKRCSVLCIILLI